MQAGMRTSDAGGPMGTERAQRARAPRARAADLATEDEQAIITEHRGGATCACGLHRWPVDEALGKRRCELEHLRRIVVVIDGVHRAIGRVVCCAVLATEDEHAGGNVAFA